MIPVDLIFLGALFIIFLVGGSIAGFTILSRVKWPFKVNILQDIPPYGYIPVKKDRAKLVKFGDGGEELFYLKKTKAHKLGYGKRIGKNSIAWGIGQDGYWYNCTFGNLDKKLMQIGIMPVERDLRFGNSVVRKGLEKDFGNKNFFEKWGVAITIFILIIAIAVQGSFQWIHLNKQIEIDRINSETAKTNVEVVKSQEQLMSAIANIKQGGTGLIPVGG